MKNEEILKIGKQTILSEIKELNDLEKRMDHNFVKAVDFIYKSEGKLVITGIGKSAHIANKIVATLNSTGTRAQFLHASEAIHGDLGLIEKKDVVLCISNSGTSPEIVKLVPFLKEYSTALIAMSANKNCLLAELSDAFLDTSISREACPINLAPTSSTTVQIALGDAIAVALMEVRNFKASDFAKFHPGGALGKNLLWKVEQLVKKGKKPAIDIKADIKEVITALSYSSCGITAVLDDENIVGVITDGDLRRMMLKYEDFSNLHAKDIMSVNPKSIQKNALASKAFEILKEYSIGQLVVLDNEKYFGIIDLHTLLEEGFK